MTLRRLLPRRSAAAIVASVLLLLIGPPSPSRAAPSRLPGYQYVSPMPGARLVSRWNNILIRQGGVIARTPDAGALTVTGAESGRHDGTLAVADDGRTLVFTPRAPFAPGETVSVRLEAGAATRRGPLPKLDYRFTVSPTDPRTQVAPMPGPEAAGGLRGPPTQRPESPPARRASAAPEDTLPAAYVNVLLLERDDPEPGGIFITPYTEDFREERGRMMVVDNYGMPLFFRSFPSHIIWDFKRQPDGRYTYYDPPRFMVIDSTATIVDSYQAGNGYTTDEHDLQVLPNGHALLLAYDWEYVDMSELVPDGDPDALVCGLIVQEVDNAGNVLFQWRSWDHVPITDMVDCAGDLTSVQVDCVHGNAVEPDTDGNLLLSCRNLSAILKIDRDTGRILWRLGLNAKVNDFTFFNDARGFSMQHSVRRLPNRDITVFDNGPCLSPVYSRAVQYELDEVHKTAALVWEYRDSTDIKAFSLGNVQRRKTGGTMVGWGSNHPDPKLTDLHRDRTKALELGFGSTTTWTYRAFRFPWVTTRFAASPTTLDFDTLRTGMEQVKSFWVTNPGTEDLVINGFATTGPVFSISDPVPIVIPPGDSARIHARFAPSEDGPHTGAVYARAVNDTELVAVAVACNGFASDAVLSAPDHAAAGYALGIGRPNPFRAALTIPFDLARPGPVTLEVFDIHGRRIATLVHDVMTAGRHTAVWRPEGRPDGVYFYRLNAGPFTATRRIALVE